jgi:hypothetical protein
MKDAGLLKRAFYYGPRNRRSWKTRKKRVLRVWIFRMNPSVLVLGKVEEDKIYSKQFNFKNYGLLTEFSYTVY